MILDLALLLAVVVGVQLLQNKYPNMLFFPKGAVLFLPPDNVPDQKPSKKEKPMGEISIIKVEYSNVKEYPFSS